MKMEKKLEKLVKNGKWWEMGYWDEKDIISQIPFSQKEIDNALKILKRTFPPKWFLNQIKVEKWPGPITHLHPLSRQLIMGGTYPLTFLVELAQNIQEMEKIQGGKRLIRKLKKDRENFKSILDEIRIISSLSKYFNVKLPFNSPDMLIKINGTEIGIEIKTLLETKIEKLLGNFIVSHFMPKLRIKGYKTKIVFLPSFQRSLQVCKKLSEEDCYIFIENIIAPYLSELHENIKNGHLKGKTKYFKYTFEPLKHNKEISCEISIPFLISNPEERIISKIEEIKKKGQLPENLPGIIILSHSHLSIDNECIEYVISYLKSQKYQGKLLNVCAVFLFHYFYSVRGRGLGKISKTFTDSPYWNRNIEKAIQIIRQKL